MFDEAKDASNRKKHGLSFSQFAGFDDQPIVIAHERSGERRFRAIGRIDGICYAIAYVVRGPDIRLISFRRAHKEELERNDD